MTWLTPQRAADYLGCSLVKIYELTREGAIKGYVKPWSKSRPYQLIAQEDIDAYVRSWATIDQMDGEEDK